MLVPQAEAKTIIKLHANFRVPPQLAELMPEVPGSAVQKDAHPFLKPVDVKYSKCPDYFDIIKQPMDLGTIQKKFPGKGKQVSQFVPIDGDRHTLYSCGARKPTAVVCFAARALKVRLDAA